MIPSHQQMEEALSTLQQQYTGQGRALDVIYEYLGHSIDFTTYKLPCDVRMGNVTVQRGLNLQTLLDSLNNATHQPTWLLYPQIITENSNE